MKGRQLKNSCENLTGPANFHFFVPAAARVAVAYGTIDKPAEVTAFKFPGGALLFLGGCAILDFPAGFIAVRGFFFAGDQKIHLSLHRRWDGPPSLLVAVDRF